MARKKQLPQPANWRAVILGTVLFVALGIGLITVFKAGADQQRHVMANFASGAALEASRKAITDTYLFTDAGHCADVAGIICWLR
jgi:hypothetical protein